MDIFSDVNIAEGQPTWQWDEGWGGVPSRAVDGDDNPQWGGASCSHTMSHVNAWWAVDLGGFYEVTSIQVTNRADCCCE